MLKDTLFKGKGSGRPFFLAWAAGVFVAYGLLHAGILAGLLKQKPGVVYTYYFVSFGLLSMWQAMLSFPTQCRRTLWISLYAAVILPVMYCESKGIWPPTWFSYDWVAAALQAGLLVGARKRVWAWIAALLITLPLSHQKVIAFSLSKSYSDLLSQLPQFLRPDLMLSFGHALYMAKALIFGLVVAFLMPPVNDDARS